MKTYRVRLMLPTLLLAALLIWGFGPARALAQCGGSMHDQHMGNFGNMGSGYIGMYGNQAPVQPDPNAIPPGYVTPVAPPVSEYTGPQNTGHHGQMTGKETMPSGHKGHMSH